MKRKYERAIICGLSGMYSVGGFFLILLSIINFYPKYIASIILILIGIFVLSFSIRIFLFQMKLSNRKI